MHRLCLCLLFLLISAGAGAREGHKASNDSDGCADRATATTEVEAAPAKPATEKRTGTPSIRSESPGRLGSLRWHSFLPGMFR